MKASRITRACLVTCLSGTAMVAAPVQAQKTFLPSSRPVQFIVPNTPGGGPDFIARLMAPYLSTSLSTNFIVENRASSNGVVASEYLARATADGHTLGFGNAGTHAINATLYKKLPYDPVRDFAPVSEVAVATLALVINPKLPVASVKELIAEAKKAPGKFNVAVAGATGEVSGNAIKLMAGIDMKNVPYKGGSPAVVAVISGEADMTLTNYTAISGHVNGGRLKVIGTTGLKRSAVLPNVPTIAEGGLDGYEYELWYAVFLPAKTPQAVVKGYYGELSRILQIPDVREKLLATGHEIKGTTPDELGAKVKREVEKYRKIILESGMQQES